MLAITIANIRKGNFHMTLAETLLHQLNNPKLSHDERVRLRCQLAEELEQRGQYEAARNALGELWRGIGQRPVVEGIADSVLAEVLLRAGTLSGWLGSANQVAGAQEAAKDLISESVALFEKIEEPHKASNARSELALCYWREGAFDEARILLEDIVLRAAEAELKAKTLLRLVLVEFSVSRFHQALSILTEAAPLFDATENQVFKGRFHGQLALVLKRLGTAEGRKDYLDRAVIEYTAASYHFEQAGHALFRARDENNLGFLLFIMGRYDEAVEHLDCARRLFVSYEDAGSIAQVDETRARLLVAQGRNAEAERIIRGAVETFERGGEQSLLAEALTTQGVVFARLGQFDESYRVLQRAMSVAEQAGALVYAGRAALALMEEHGERMTAGQGRKLYMRADDWLSKTQDAEDVSRLRACARALMSHGDVDAQGGASPLSFTHAGKQMEELLEIERALITSQAEPITEEALKLLRLRATGKGTAADPWAEFSFMEEVQLYEERLIARALQESHGRVTQAAHLLGLKHQTLIAIIKSRHRRLLDLRSPVQPRRRSIIKRR